MKQFYAFTFISCALVIGGAGTAKAQCYGAYPSPINTPAAETMPQIEVGSMAAGSNVLNVVSTYGFAVGMTVTGGSLPAGTTVTAVNPPTQLQLSNNSPILTTGISYTFNPWVAFPPATPWGNQLPPTSNSVPNCAYSGLFTVPVCSNNFTRVQFCTGNVYTISLCSSSPAWDSFLTLTDNAGNALATPLFDDNGCGASLLSTITYTHTGAPVLAYVRIRTAPCTLNSTNCGTLEISVSPAPAPPANDNPCLGAGVGAVNLPVTTACNMTSGTGSFATQTATPNTTGLCTPLSGYDVWYSATVPASGYLAVQLDQVSALDIAMAVYSYVPSGTCPAGTWTLQACNADLALPSTEPFISAYLPAFANQTVYIRVWPQGGNPNNGTFQICAYEPVPPTNDQPCGATPLTVGSPCSATTFTTESATPISGVTLSPATPGCGTPVAGGDVWFSFVATVNPVVINTFPGSLTDMAMAVYSLSGSCNAGTLTQMTCDDNSGVDGTMPMITQGSLTIGNTYYIRLWNKTGAFGTASICVTPTTAPPNDDPCGAVPLPVNTGCLFSGYSSANATQTSTAPPNTASVPNPAAPCAGTPANDVWYTAVVPSNGVLQFDTDEGQMTNAAMTVYTSTGSCGSGNLALTQVGSDCNSSANGNMPYLSVSGLTPGATVYVRVWMQTGTAGTFLMCARSTVPPAGTCNYTLRMEDSGGNGWNGSYVRVCIDPPGAPPAVCTDYTVAGAYADVNIGANVGDLITLQYFAVGGFQNQISYELVTPAGGVIFASPNPPGPLFAMTVDGVCNVPPAPPEDCVGAITLCNSQSFSFPPVDDGAVNDLTAGNQGCLLGGESIGVWLRFRAQVTGDLAFTITVANGTDYDFAVWGPYGAAPPCPPSGPPLRCSWSGATGNTGLNYVATDLSEGAGGDKWVRYIDANAGDWFVLYVDNWSQNTTAFTLNWNNLPPNILDCTLPLEMLSFEAVPKPRQVDLDWVTGSEDGTSHFGVERSTDGVHFHLLGRVPAAGNSITPREYHFVDAAPASGVNYYRLDQVDANGEREYSKTVTATFRRSTLALDLYPNPAGNSVFAAFEMSGEGSVRWRVMDMSGRLVSTGPAAVTAGINQLEIPLNTVEAGSYLLELIDDSGGTMGNARFVRQ